MPTDFFLFPALVDGFCAVLMLVMWIVASWIGGVALAGRSQEPGCSSHRLAAALVIAGWLPVAMGVGLLSVGAFLRPAAVVCLGVVVVGAWRWLDGPAAWKLFGEDADRARAILFGRGPNPMALVALVGLLAVGARVFRGLATPPLAWDALTYHLVRAGRWAATGGWAYEAAPDAWRYYEFFPPVADLHWAWAMLATRSDSILILAGFAVWIGCGAGAFTLARGLGAAPRLALAAAMAIAFLPPLTSFIAASDADNTLLFFHLTGLSLLTGAMKEHPRHRIGLATGAFLSFALAASSKVTGLPTLMLGGGMALWLTRKAPLWQMVPMLLAATPALAMMARAWFVEGSPLYPMEIRVGGLVLLEGNDQLRRLNAGELGGWGQAIPPFSEQVATILEFSFFQPLFLLGRDHIGFGYLAPIALVFGILGALRIANPRTGLSWVVGLMVAIVAIQLAAFLSPGFTGQRVWWLSTRFLTTPFVLIAVMAAGVDGQAMERLLLAMAATGILVGLPPGWTGADWYAMMSLLPWFTLATIGGVLGWWLVRRFGWSRSSAVWIAGATGLLLLLPPLEAVRLRHRHSIYEASAHQPGPAYDVFPLAPPYAGAWPLWREVDRPGQSLRIAVTAGWDGSGHNWFRYPMMGSSLQNDILYIPISKEGEIIDHEDNVRLVETASPQAWFRRLFSENIDIVASLPPSPLERRWLDARPDLFEPIAEGSGGHARAYRIQRDQMERALLSE